MKRSEILSTVLLVPLDAVALLGAFSLAYYLRGNFAVPGLVELGPLADQVGYTGAQIVLTYSQYLHYLGVIIPAMIAIFAAAGLYAIRSGASWWRKLYQIMIGVSVGEFFILLLFLLKKEFFIPRSTVLYSWVLAVLFVLLARELVRLVRRIFYVRDIGVIRLGVIGKNKVAERLIAQLTESRYSPYRLSLHMDALDVPGIAKRLDQEGLDELIVVAPHYSNEELVELRTRCLERHIAFSFVPPLLTELPGSTFEIRSAGRLPMIEIRPTPLEGWGRVIKRLFDLVASLLLIVLFSPIFLIIILAMLATDPGPLIYRHRRIGKDRRPIDVWKFRSMRWDYCDGPGGNPEGDRNKERLFRENPDLAKEWAETQKLKNDPRVSLIGRVLRKTSLDELPQFFNVLGGSLSLVGPRPIIQEEVVRYGDKATILFTVKPGVTGLWQVSGRNDVGYDERIALDARYIERWNLLTDIRIMVKTFFVLLAGVLGKRGAY